MVTPSVCQWPPMNAAVCQWQSLPIYYRGTIGHIVQEYGVLHGDTKCVPVPPNGSSVCQCNSVLP